MAAAVSPDVPTKVLQPFKGIAVFTPGGDLVYCIDTQKRTQWHIHLCGALQEHLGLVESPHFLVPTFTATVDCWVNPETQSLELIAEMYTRISRYQGLLNAVFRLDDLEWQIIRPRQEHQSSLMIDAYRSRFPQLWECNDVVMDLSPPTSFKAKEAQTTPETHQQSTSAAPVLRLFISGHSAMIEKIMTTLQEALERSRYRPYTLQVIDVAKHPEQAESDQISATPTLLRVWPQPTRRLVGQLIQPKAVLDLINNL